MARSFVQIFTECLLHACHCFSEACDTAVDCKLSPSEIFSVSQREAKEANMVAFKKLCNHPPLRDKLVLMGTRLLVSIPPTPGPPPLSSFLDRRGSSEQETSTRERNMQQDPPYDGMFPAVSQDDDKAGLSILQVRCVPILLAFQGGQLHRDNDLGLG